MTNRRATVSTPTPGPERSGGPGVFVRAVESGPSLKLRTRRGEMSPFVMSHRLVIGACSLVIPDPAVGSPRFAGRIEPGTLLSIRGSPRAGGNDVPTQVVCVCVVRVARVRRLCAE